MEDADLCVPKLPTPLEDWSLYAVFDGHGGDETAKKAAEKVVRSCASYFKYSTSYWLKVQRKNLY